MEIADFQNNENFKLFGQFFTNTLEFLTQDELLPPGKHRHKHHNQCKFQHQFYRYRLPILHLPGIHQYMIHMLCIRH